MPKQLIPVANKPVLEYVIENIRDTGVTEVGIVVGHREPEISAAVGDGSRFGVDITYIRQEQPLGLAHAVRLARPFLGAEDFVLYLGDNFLAEGVVEIAADFSARRPAAQLVLHKVADPSAYGVAEIDADGSVRRLVEKPSQPRSDLAVVGVYFFTPAVHKAVDAIGPSARGELEITDAIQWLVDQGAEVAAREYGGFWRDVGRIDDILSCNRRQLDALRPAVRGRVDPASELHGQVVIEDGARVVRSRIDGPALVGAATVVEDSWIGPGTSLGCGCVVRASRLSESVVMDGARICEVSGVRGSIVGRRATVGTVARGEPGHRLVVGDDVRVEIDPKRR
jgi:glucose-1-phosphate thymidylyltransferase